MPSELTIQSLTHEREVLYQLKRELGILKGDLEILAFAYTNMFFSLYDLKKHYKHTNIQQLSRSLQKLSNAFYLRLVNRGSKGNPAAYSITPDGEKLLNRYQVELTGQDGAKVRSAVIASINHNPLKEIIRYRM